MYILKLENNSNFFAVCNNDKTFIKAIEEETLLTGVKINKFITPDWGESVFLNALGLNDEQEKEEIKIEVQKIVNY